MTEHEFDTDRKPLKSVLQDAVPDRFEGRFADQILQRLRDDPAETQSDFAEVIARLPRAFAWSLTPALVLLAVVAWQNWQLPGGGPLVAGMIGQPGLIFDAGPLREGEAE